jgi:arginine N-succinyltransferase
MPSMPPVREKHAVDKTGDDGLLIRPAASSDVDDFYELARLAGAGFTSLPVNRELLAERLIGSERAFAGLPGILTLALEDRSTKTVVGCAAVKPGGKARPHFLNFQISADGQTLTPTAKYGDMTEVGSLLLHPDYRAHGVGPWLARSRYLLIAADPARFGDAIFSELRGVVNEDDRSPFYDGVCAPYFNCSFADADELCAHGLQADLNALLPSEPIALAGLRAEAREAMGKPHRAGRRALDYLEREGFRFEGIVDLLDGGPAVVSKTCAIRTIRSTVMAPLRGDKIDGQEGLPAYLSVGEGLDFRCCRTAALLDGDRLLCSNDSLALLNATGGTMARACFVDEGGGGRAVRDKVASTMTREKTFAGTDARSD